MSVHSLTSLPKKGGEVIEIKNDIYKTESHQPTRKYKIRTKSGLFMSLKPMHQTMFESKSDYESILTFIYRTLALDKEQKDIATNLNQEVFPSENFILDETNKSAVAGSFSQLLLYLTSADSPILFHNQFLQTFMSFSTPRLILAFLITRYFAYKVNNNEDNLKLRDRVIHILDIWTSITSFQFDENMIESLEMFSTFLNDEEKNINHSSQVTAIIQKIKGNIKHEEKIQLPECPEPIINMNLPEDEWTLQNVHPLELARQVTLLHYSIFKQIEPNELLDDIWGDKKSRASVNIDHLVEHFTMFSSYVSLSIITGETAKVRGKVFKNWIDVAKQFLDLNNFHGVFSVILGLTHRSVSRMSNTMKYAMKTNSKRKKEYEKMLNICNISNDFQNYRSIITTAKEPCIPFIGCYQKDLIYVQETFPNKVNGLINFRKCQECYKLVKTIQDFQRIGYNFMEVPKIQKLLEYLPEPTDSIDLMKLSMAKEKKEKEKKK